MKVCLQGVQKDVQTLGVVLLHNMSTALHKLLRSCYGMYGSPSRCLGHASSSSTTEGIDLQS